MQAKENRPRFRVCEFRAVLNRAFAVGGVSRKSLPGTGTLGTWESGGRTGTKNFADRTGVRASGDRPDSLGRSADARPANGSKKAELAKFRRITRLSKRQLSKSRAAVGKKRDRIPYVSRVPGAQY